MLGQEVSTLLMVTWLAWTIMPTQQNSEITETHDSHAVFRSNSDVDLGDAIEAAEANLTLSHPNSRRRRYVVFPEGSSFTVAFCVSFKALTGSDSIFTEGVNWALSYDLPNETKHHEKKQPPMPLRRHKRELYQRVEILMNSFKNGFSPEELAGNIFTEGVNWGLRYHLPSKQQTLLDNPRKTKKSMRRHKRDLYLRVEKLLNSAGFDGRTCLLRTICETAQLIPPRHGVIQEIIRILFTYEFNGGRDSTQRSRRTRKGAHFEYALAHSNGVSDEHCYDSYPCPISMLDLLLQFGVKDSNTGSDTF